MLTRTVAALPILLVVALAARGEAYHCETGPGPVNDPEVDTQAPHGGRYYVDIDVCQPECALAIWIYEESNGIDGLHRSDARVDDTHCGIPADTLLQAVYA